MRPFAAAGMSFVLLGLVVASCASTSRRRIAEFGTAPQRISLESLIDRGPAGPRNVIVTDYRLCQNYVVEQHLIKQRTGAETARWQRAYIPIEPAPRPGDGLLANLEPLKVSVVIHCPDVVDEKQLVQRCGGPELKGLVVGTARDLEPKEQKLLKDKYPDTDLAKCIVITEGEAVNAVRNPAVVENVGLVLLGCGGVCLAIAAVLWSDKRVVIVGWEPPPSAPGPDGGASSPR